QPLAPNRNHVLFFPFLRSALFACQNVFFPTVTGRKRKEPISGKITTTTRSFLNNRIKLITTASLPAIDASKTHSESSRRHVYRDAFYTAATASGYSHLQHSG